MPANSPVCVPVNVFLVTTWSPSAIMSSMVNRESGKAFKNPNRNVFPPSRSEGMPGGELRLKNAGSFSSS